MARTQNYSLYSCGRISCLVWLGLYGQASKLFSILLWKDILLGLARPIYGQASKLFFILLWNKILFGLARPICGQDSKLFFVLLRKNILLGLARPIWSGLITILYTLEEEYLVWSG